MSPAQRRARLAASLRRQNLTLESIEEDYCKSVFLIEHDLGHYVDDDYPVTKFLEEVRLLNWYKEEEKKAMDGIE